MSDFTLKRKFPITANPQGIATGTLTKLGIGSEIYDIQGGSGGEYRLLTGTLLANAWSNNTQTVTIQGISSTTNGVIGLLDSATSTQIESAKSSEINVTTIGTNSVSFVCKNVPTVDIPFGILVGGGGGGVSTLADLTDVNISNPTDGQILQYDAASQKWVNHINEPRHISITVDIYSAASDTVTFTDRTGQKTVTSGDSITFTSSVAKNPSDLSENYSKTVNVTSSTTAVYVMPNDNTLYWYGYNGGVEAITANNGWSYTGSSRILSDCTFSTNHVNVHSNGENYVSGVGATSKKDINEVHLIADATISSGTGYLLSFSSKDVAAYNNLGAEVLRGADANIYGVWYE